MFSIFKKPKLFAAVAGVRRISTQNKNTLKFGDFEIDNTNPFIKFEQISKLDIIEGPLNNAALEMCSGFEIYTEPEHEELNDKLREWAAVVDLDSYVLSLASELMSKGTVVTHLIIENGGISKLKILPMRYITLLTEKEKPGDVPNYVIQGEIDKIIVNEGSLNKVKQEVLTLDEVEITRYRHHTNFFKDIKRRTTYGIYGRSLIEKIEWRLQFYLDILESYRKFVKRYGYGRLFINAQVIAKLIEEGKYDLAMKVLDDIKDEQEKIEENEDIVGVGMDVKQLDTKTGLDIVTIKESLEKDIATYLFGSEVTIGKAKGTTYASAKKVEEARVRILESYRRQLRRSLERILNKQAELLGYKNVAVKVRFKALDREKYTAEDVAKLYTNGVLTLNEARELVGYPPLDEE